MRTGCHTGHGTAKRQKGNRLGSQKLNQHAAFSTVRMQAHVHSVAMVPTPARVQIRLAERTQRQRPLELPEKKLLDSTRIGEFPLSFSFDDVRGSRFVSRRLGTLDSNHFLAIEKSGDVSAFVPVAVRTFSHF